MSSYTLSTRPPAPSNSSTSNSSLPRPRPSSSVDVFSAAPNTGSTTLFTPFDPSPASPDALQHDPLDSLARSKTPFFLAIQEEPRTPSRFSLTLGDLSHGRGSPESPLQALNEGISGSTAWSGGAVGGAVWTSPGGVQGSMAPASKMDFGTAAEWKAAFINVSDPALDLKGRIVQLTSMLSSIHVRVTSLERDNAMQEVEIRQLRALIRSPQDTPCSSHTPPRPSTPPYTFPFYQQSSSARPLQPHARPFDPNTPTPSLISSAFPSPSAVFSPVAPSIPHSHSYPGYSPTDSLSYSSPFSSFGAGELEFDSPTSLLMSRRRSRVGAMGAGMEMVQGRRDRVASMSAVSPGMAQALWMTNQGQQAVPPRPTPLPLQPLDTINYRALLEHETDIDDEAFVMRVVTQNDQQCSLFLQQRVRSGTNESHRLAIYSAVGKHLHALCLSKFGNFLVSRCLENGGPKLAEAYTRALVGHFFTLAVDPYGCHVTQKLLDCGDASTKEHVINELISHSETLTQKAALHVWNRLLTTPNPPRFYEQLVATGKGLWVEVAKDEGGSLVIQRICEDWSEAHTSSMAREIFDGLEQVATCSCGSFVLSHLLARNALPFRNRLLELAPTIAADGYGAKVVEKCLSGGRVAPAVVSAFIEAIVRIAEPDALPIVVDIATHGNGAQLLSVLIVGSATSYEDKTKLVKSIIMHANILKQTPHGAKVVLLCERTRS